MPSDLVLDGGFHSMVILDAARAFRRLAPMALAELPTHAQLAHNARYQVTVAAREAYMQQLPWLRLLLCSAGFRNPRADAGTRKASFHRSGRAHRCPSGSCRALTRSYVFRCLQVGSGNRRMKGGNSLGFHRP